MASVFSTIMKFFLAAVFFPYLLAAVMVFKEYVMTYPGGNGIFFLWGAGSFLLIFLFFYQFWGIYEFGQGLLARFFRFTKPFDSFFTVLVSPYVAVILGGYYITQFLLKIHGYDHYFFFFTGFAGLMHILLTAQDLQEQEKSLLKPNYYFVIVVVVILNIILAAVALDLLSGHNGTKEFLNQIHLQAKHYYELSVGRFL